MQYSVSCSWDLLSLTLMTARHNDFVVLIRENRPQITLAEPVSGKEKRGPWTPVDAQLWRGPTFDNLSLFQIVPAGQNEEGTISFFKVRGWGPRAFFIHWSLNPPLTRRLPRLQNNLTTSPSRGRISFSQISFSQWAYQPVNNLENIEFL